jgi:hypothetical protein
MPPYHKATFHCHECGIVKEDKQLYHYVDKGWDFFIDNLEPVLTDWHCPQHPKGMVGVSLQEFPRERVQTFSEKDQEGLEVR